MRAVLLAVVLMAAVAHPAAAGPPLFAAWDLQPSRSASIRLGASTLEQVTVPARGYVLGLFAIRTTWAPRPWIEIGVGGHIAAFSGGTGHHLDFGFGIPNLHVGWAHALTPSLRLGVLARSSIGAAEKAGSTSPADVASGAFLLDEAITWTQTWTWTLHTDLQWSNGCTTVQGGAGASIYAGRALPHVQTVLRLQGGAAWQVTDAWSTSAEMLLLTDVLDEGYKEPYDIVPVATVAVRHRARWRLGAALSYGWVAAATGVGRPGLVVVFDATRAL